MNKFYNHFYVQPRKLPYINHKNCSTSNKWSNWHNTHFVASKDSSKETYVMTSWYLYIKINCMAILVIGHCTKTITFFAKIQIWYNWQKLNYFCSNKNSLHQKLLDQRNFMCYGQYTQSNNIGKICLCTQASIAVSVQSIKTYFFLGSAKIVKSWRFLA